MSKFLDRLEKINRGVPASMGFGAAHRVEKIPSLALIGSISDSKKAGQAASNLATIGADGVVIDGISIEDVVQGVAKNLGDIPWGLRVDSLKREDAAGYREKGCDFLAFGPQAAQLGAFEDEDTGYFLCIPPDMEERYLRSVEDLPVDAALLAMKSVEPPITLEHLITIGAVRGCFSKYLLLEVSGTLSTSEMDGLREMGVDGLVVDATRLTLKELEGLKDALLALPRKQRAKSNKLRALVPSGAFSPSNSPAQEEQEEDEEYN